MPFVKIATSVAMDEAQARAMAHKAADLAAQMTGKPVMYVQAAVVPNMVLLHGGTDAPSAYVEFKSIGLSENDCPRYAVAICAFLKAECGVAPDKTYIEFKDLSRSLFGWDGRTFG